MTDLRAHLRSLGPAWTHWTTLPLIAWPLYVVFGRGELRWEWIAFFFVVPAVAFIGPRTRTLYVGLFPIAVVPVIYDGMRVVKYLGITPERVHICDLRNGELSLFGVGSGAGRVTLQDYFLVHRSDVADLFFAIPYGTFIFVAIAFGVFLFTKSFAAIQRYGWTFLWLNVAGFLTYHIYPSAPPWYYHLTHSCLADLTAHASEGVHLANVDRIIGVSYFASFYGRSSDVFGAVPSLHVAYPALIVIEGWPFFRALGRAVSLLFWASMCCAAVYLDHHYVIDVLLGLVYTAVIYLACKGFLARLDRKRSRGAAADMGAAVASSGGGN
jgi:membrane-associated phospholipid phosphatase